MNSGGNTPGSKWDLLKWLVGGGQGAGGGSESRGESLQYHSSSALSGLLPTHPCGQGRGG